MKLSSLVAAGAASAFLTSVWMPLSAPSPLSRLLTLRLAQPADRDDKTMARQETLYCMNAPPKWSEIVADSRGPRPLTIVKKRPRTGGLLLRFLGDAPPNS